MKELLCVDYGLISLRLFSILPHECLGLAEPVGVVFLSVVGSANRLANCLGWLTCLIGRVFLLGSYYE